MIAPVQQPELYCEICDRDFPDETQLNDWDDMLICDGCMAEHDAMLAEDDEAIDDGTL